MLSVADSAYDVVDILVDLASVAPAPTPTVTPTPVDYAEPQNLRVSATATAGELRLTWTNPSGFDSRNDFHEYQYRKQGSTAWLPSTPAITVSSDGSISVLEPGAYEVRLRAVYRDSGKNFEGNSDWVTEVGTPLAPPPQLSSDATLSALGITPSVTLVPAFTAATESYEASADNAVASLQVTPTVKQANATVTVNNVAVTSGSPSAPISLTAGETTDITVVVTAQDGTTMQTYTVRVTRAAAPLPPSNPLPQSTPVLTKR